MSSRLSLPTYTYLYGFTQEQIVSLASIQYESALHIKVNAAKNYYLDYYISHFRLKILLESMTLQEQKSLT